MDAREAAFVEEGERMKDRWLNPPAMHSGGFQLSGTNPIRSDGGLGSFEFNRIAEWERRGTSERRTPQRGDQYDGATWVAV